MANKLKFSRGLENNLPAPVDGAVRFCTDTGSLYIDNNKERIKINAGKADQLTEKRTISLTGAITGAVEFDGSTDVIMNTTNAMDSIQLIEDSEIAYSKDLPVANVSKYATITEIGGMSRKCENLFNENALADYNGIVKNGNGYYEGTSQKIQSAMIEIFNGTQIKENTIYSVYLEGYVVPETAGQRGIFIQAKYTDGTMENLIILAETTNIIKTATTNLSKSVASIMFSFGTSSVVNYIKNICIREGTDTTYQPYFTGLRDAKVTAVESVGANLYCGSKTTEYSGNNITYKWDKEEQIITITSTSSVTTELFVPLENVIDIVGGETYSIKSVILENTSTLNWLFGICDSNRRYATSEGYSALSDITSVKTYTFAKDAHIDMLHIFVPSDGAGSVNAKFKLMLNEGSTALPYSPYFKNTFQIPEAVQALEGYGQGISKEYHNKIVLDPTEGVKKFVKATKTLVLSGEESIARVGTRQFAINIADASNSSYAINDAICSHFEYIVNSYGTSQSGFVTNDSQLIIRYPEVAEDTSTAFQAYLAEQYAAGTPVTLEYALAEPIETDVSAYFTDDNLIGVEAGGTVTAVNEYEYDVPFTINYSYGKNYDIISSKKFIGDLDGMATRAISDSNGKIITNTYLPKENGITDLAINGKIITYTKGDGTKGTLTTQDTISTLASLGIIATATELNYCDGVTSNIQAQLNSKQNIIGGAASSVVSNNLTGNKVLISNGSGKIAASSVTNTELGYLSGLTGSIKNSLSNKVSYVGTTPASVEASAFYCKLCTVTVPKGYYHIYFEFDLVGRSVGRFQNIKCAATKSGALALNNVKIFVSGNNGNIYEVVGYKNVITSDSVGDTLELWCKVPSWDKLNVFHRKIGGMSDGSQTKIQDWITWEYTKNTALPTESSTKVKVSASLEAWQGNATTAATATKLSTSAGSATNPIYFKDGKPVACTYTLGKSVPSDAKFTDTTYSAATTSASGLMTADMVTKLNGIATGANKYILPNATSSALGGVRIGSNITVSSGTISLTKENVTAALGYTPPTVNTTYSIATASAAGLVKPISVITKPTINSTTTTSGRYYSIQMSSDGNMFVNVPWVNTTYSLSSFGITATATELNYVDGVTSNIQTQLNGKAASSHTHSIANVTNLQSELDKKLNFVGGNGTSSTHKPYIWGGGFARYGDTIGKSGQPDNYYCVVDSDHSLYLGVQVNGAENPTWVSAITSKNIGSQSVNYATSAGRATKATQDGSGNTITSTYLKLSGGTMSGQIAFPNNSSLYPLSFSASNGGALVDTYGNFRAASTSAQTWNLMDSGGITRFSVKWATGDTTIEGALSTKGRLTASGKISIPTSGSSWISGMTTGNASIAISTQNTSGSYHPIMAGKTYNGHIWNLGTYVDNIGFYGFKSGRTENATDWSFAINVSSGAINASGSITAASFHGSGSGLTSLNASNISSGTLAVARGGTGITSNPSMLINLGSTSAANVFATRPRPGITGTLGLANGGTGKTTAKDAANAFINALDTGSSAPVDADYYICQYAGGGTSTTTYHRRPTSALWTYMKGKIDTTYYKTVTKSGAIGSVTLADKTDYIYTGVTSLTLVYPSGNFECWLSVTTSTSAITLSFPSGTKFIGASITSLVANTTYEISIKNKVAIIKKVG